MTLSIKTNVLHQCCMECCGKLDKHGDHAVVCKYGTGVIYRHDLIVLGISHLLKQSNIKHVIELRHLFKNNNMKPADIYIENWTDSGGSAAIDIGITSVTRDTILDESESKLLSAANDFYKAKINKYKKYVSDNNINTHGLTYQPMIIEDYGGFHKESVKFIKKLGELRAANLNIDKGQSIHYCFTYISSKLFKANAIALLNHYSIYCDQDEHEIHNPYVT